MPLNSLPQGGAGKLLAKQIAFYVILFQRAGATRWRTHTVMCLRRCNFSIPEAIDIIWSS